MGNSTALVEVELWDGKIELESEVEANFPRNIHEPIPAE